MKLYVWRPDGHGQLTFSVVAESEEEAFRSVDDYIVAHYFRFSRYDYEAQGWKTDYFKLEVYDAGSVCVNDND